jgi:hypothetical protein
VDRLHPPLAGLRGERPRTDPGVSGRAARLALLPGVPGERPDVGVVGFESERFASSAAIAILSDGSGFFDSFAATSTKSSRWVILLPFPCSTASACVAAARISFWICSIRISSDTTALTASRFWLKRRRARFAAIDIDALPPRIASHVQIELLCT